MAADAVQSDEEAPLQVDQPPGVMHRPQQFTSFGGKEHRAAHADAPVPLVMPPSFANRPTASSICCSDIGKPGNRDSRCSGIARIIRPLWGSKRRLANSPSPSDS